LPEAYLFMMYMYTTEDLVHETGKDYVDKYVIKYV